MEVAGCLDITLVVAALGSVNAIAATIAAKLWGKLWELQSDRAAAWATISELERAATAKERERADAMRCLAQAAEERSRELLAASKAVSPGPAP